MTLPVTTPLKPVPVDEDLAEQAHPGRGIPSQDPESAAQFPLTPEEAEREAKSVLIGGGVVAGAASGAAIGAVVGGPVGVVVGGTLGTVVGALSAAAAGAIVKPEGANSADTAGRGTMHLHTKGHAGRVQPTVKVGEVIASSASEIRRNQ